MIVREMVSRLTWKRQPPPSRKIHFVADADHITRLLGEIHDGRAAAADELLLAVYQQLHAIAQQRMNQERAGHTLQATALVHEAYLRLVGNEELDWDSRGHFFAAAAEAMRRILIEHARARLAEKRGGPDRRRLDLQLVDVADLADGEKSLEIIALNEAFRRLEVQEPRVAQVVRLRFFAGLSVDEAAAVLGVSPRTVALDWKFGRAWLFRTLSEP